MGRRDHNFREREGRNKGEKRSVYERIKTIGALTRQHVVDPFMVMTVN